ncbi:CoA pyrophosphatase [Elioraea rosea]|uniref:CoA pyrophosphatase n=1 Tax=Elioraea rosea TaxID=2492390 RepID=UPI001EF4915B|nr:CoA pyrophosphatase [Elioraea rosea]
MTDAPRRAAASDRPRLSAGEVAARIAAMAPGQGYDARGHAASAIEDAALMPAAVLVPIVARPEPTILLTLRGRHLKAHAGQVAFPGGRIEAGDADAVAAALREAEEEIGLAPRTVSVIGQLAEHITGTGYRVTPVIGMLEPPLLLSPDPAEVEEVFELPLAEVLDPAARSWREERLLGRIRRFWVVRHERHLIWGATAAMLVALGTALEATREV